MNIIATFRRIWYKWKKKFTKEQKPLLKTTIHYVDEGIVVKGVFLDGETQTHKFKGISKQVVEKSLKEMRDSYKGKTPLTLDIVKLAFAELITSLQKQPGNSKSTVKLSD